MHQAFYRKWRPQFFDDVCGQEHITSVLKYETEHQSFSHAYLFCGSRGTGKTTCAKILSKAVNCLQPKNGNPCGECEACRAIDSGAATDVLEMDAASNNGVDNIRDIRDEVVYAPSALKYRVYIIDEVHMLSVSAFNALLKTLEEPPEHVVFVLATTELQKLPATIISRCQRFDFRRISTDALVGRLQFIAEQEHLQLHPEAARMLAKLAQGGMRDAISLLELCAGGQTDITEERVTQTVGLTGRDAMLRTVEAIAGKNYDALFDQVREVVESSKDLTVFWQDLISLYRDMLVVKSTSRAASYLDLTDSETAQMKTLAQKFSKETLLSHCKLLEDALFSMQKANSVKRIVAELTLVRMCDESLDTSNEAILSRLASLEDRVSMGNFAPMKVREANSEESASAGQGQAEQGTFNGSSAQSDPVKKTEPKTELQSPSAPAKRILRPLRSWMEVVERLGQTDMPSASFCKQAKAFTTEEGSVVVQFGNDLSRSMVSADRLRAALSSVLHREMSEKELLMEVCDSLKKSVMDEIMEAVEEQELF